jgi:hypothetical protein
VSHRLLDRVICLLVGLCAGCGVDPAPTGNAHGPEALLGVDDGRPDFDPRVGDRPIYVRVLFHFENITEMNEGGDLVLEQLQLMERLGLPGEVDLHRGEHQARYYELLRPDIIEALAETTLNLGYHPHLIEPFLSRVDDLEHMSWNDAVAGMRAQTECPIEVRSGEITENCAATGWGGLRRVIEVLGRNDLVGATSDGGINAVPTYVLGRDYGVRVQNTGSYESFPEPEVRFFWYMGTLVVKGPACNKSDWWTTFDALADTLDAIPGPETGFLTILGSDKARAPGMQDWAIEHWEQDATDLFDLFPPVCASRGDCPASADEAYTADCWCENEVDDLDDCMPNGTHGLASDACFDAYLPRFEDLLTAFSSHPRVEFVGSADLAELVRPAGARLTMDILDLAASRLINSYDARANDGEVPRPMVEVPAGDTYLSLTNLYEGLLRSLLGYQTNGRFAADVRTNGTLLGPQIDPEDCPADKVAQVSVPLRRLIGTLDPDAEFVTAAASLVIDGTEYTFNAPELLYLLAKAYRQLRRTGGELNRVTVARPAVRPCPRPTGTPFDDDADLTAWEWHSSMQHWTTQRTDFRE